MDLRPAKRPRNAAVAQSWADLRPETVGQVAQFLPMGTPDMTGLLLCVGPATAGVVRNMYLTGSEYYLRYYLIRRSFLEEDTVRDRIGYWMEHNEKEWKRRCLGRAHKANVHSLRLKPKSAARIDFTNELTTGHLYLEKSELELYGFHYCNVLGEANYDALMNLANDNGNLLLVSVGDNNVDDKPTSMLELGSLIKSAQPDKDGNICLRFMCAQHMFFAHPEHFMSYGMVDVLRFIIENGNIDPNRMVQFIHEGDDLNKMSLLFQALMCNEGCFRYLLSLPSMEINAVAFSVQAGTGQSFLSIIHCCFFGYFDDDRSPSYLKAIIDCAGVDLNARNSKGETALVRGLLMPPTQYIHRSKESFERSITKVRMLLEAGADPRIADNRGLSPRTILACNISDLKDVGNEQDEELIVKLKTLRDEISERVVELNKRGLQNT